MGEKYKDDEMEGVRPGDKPKKSWVVL